MRMFRTIVLVGNKKGILGIGEALSETLLNSIELV